MDHGIDLRLLEIARQEEVRQIPLLQDVFWVSMAVTIMAGLAFGTVLTMMLVPVFYCTLYKVKSP